MHHPNEKDVLFRFCAQTGHCTINNRTYDACASFLFYTSWFEELLFNYRFRQGPDNDEKICCELFNLVELSQYDFFGDFCAGRYLTEEGTTKYFRNLRLRQSDKPRVEQSLRKYKTNHEYTWELLWSYLVITYRFRNNMFHGSKGLINLNEHVERFEIINQFMRKLIEDAVSNNYSGYNQPRQ